MEHDLLPAPIEPPPAPAPVSARKPSPIICEYCHCTLAPSGDVMKMSDEAKAMRDQQAVIDKLNAAIAERDATIGSLQTESAELRSQLSAHTTKRGIFS